MKKLFTLKEVTMWVYPDVTPQALHKWIKADAFRPETYVRSSTGPGKGNMLSVSDVVLIGILRALFSLGLGTKDLSKVRGPLLWTKGMTEAEKSEIERAGERKLQRYFELCDYTATVYYETTSIRGPHAGGFWDHSEGKPSKLEASFIVLPRKGEELWNWIKQREAPTYSIIDVSQWFKYVELILKTAPMKD